MARGRNHNRNRSIHIQTQQQQQQQHQSPQQPQQISIKHPLDQHQQHPQKQSQQQPQMQSTNASNAPVATINKQQSINSISTTIIANTINNHNLDNGSSPSTNSESYGHINKSSSNNSAYDQATTQSHSAPLDGEVPIKTHLETNGDPVNTSTASNYSLSDISQVKLNSDSSHPCEYHNDHSNSAQENRERLQSYREMADGPSLQQREEHENRQLSNGKHDEHHYINRSPVIEQSVSVIAQVTANNGQYDEISTSSRTTSHNGTYNDGQYDELTEQYLDCVLLTINEETPLAATTAMGQKNTKGDADTSPSTQIPPFRESSVPRTNDSATGSNFTRVQSLSVSVPTITVVDCSGAGSVDAKSYGSTHSEKDEFYDLENQEFSDHRRKASGEEHEQYGNKVDGQHGNASQMANAPSSYRSPSPTSMYSQMRYNYMKLEDVPEQDEEDDDEDEEEESDEEDEGNEIDEDNTKSQEKHTNAQATTVFTNHGVNLDNEFQNIHSQSLSPDRQHPKSIDICTSNSTDSNLSTSFPDSGMGESVASATNSRFINTNDGEFGPASSAAMHGMKQQHQDNFPPFVRDGSSTDCDETLMQCEELIDFVETPEFLDPSERFVCIESISLPDVVVESTNLSGNSSNASGGAVGTSSSRAGSVSDAERDIININGATGNTMGNVHFIPIHVEGGSGRSSPRKQSVDDSIVGSGKATIEIIEDVTEMQHVNTAMKSMNNDASADKLKKELLEQKTQFSSQLEDAHKNVSNLQTKINEMQMKIESLEQELSAKTWNVERLQGELNAAQRDDEYVRKKLKLLEDEKTNLRHRYSECEDELKQKYDELEIQYNELQEKYHQTQSLASNLQTQLAQAQSDAEESREEVEKIRIDLEEQISLLKNALENSENERKICEDKWQREFEMLRTQNMDREESIMTDCEWQLRQTQRQCKDRIDKAECGRKEAVENVEILEEELETLRKEIDDLKVYQAQVNSLRGVVSEQAQSIQTLMNQIETLKKDLTMANESLEEQIEAVRKIKFHCDNALYDKERQMIYRIDEVRNEAAAFWEDKLYTEMTRLKVELESVYVDERRDELDKLQVEHVEELKALTNRYTDNEEELRAELAEVQERLDRKSEEFVELREKSDNALLQTRMHLDRADREFQKAMCQEEERREALETSLRQEFEKEKSEMEDKFRERLQHVKEEFSKELQINTQELTEQHKTELQKVKAKLMAEKDEALQELTERHRKKVAHLEERIKEIETRHSRDLKDLKAAYDFEKAALDKRDISNANEIEQLHRKCRCLTNLFEEMRMRYERRDPRPEDLREIAELRTRCESQERDMYLLTDRLREMQNQMNEMQQNGVNAKKAKQVKKPPPKTIPTNCDVIYEENEERESPPPTPNSYTTETQNDDDVSDENKEQSNLGDNRSYEKKLIAKNEDDTHMITAM